MKSLRLFLLIIFSIGFFSQDISAQDTSVVNWKYRVIKEADGKQAIRLSGTIRKGWHVYAQADKEDGLEGIRVIINDSLYSGDQWMLQGNRKNIRDVIFEGNNKSIFEDSFQIIIPFNESLSLTSANRVNIQYDGADQENFIPEETKLDVSMDGSAKSTAAIRILIPSINIARPVANCGATTGVSTSTESKGLLSIFLLGFIAGLVALLTPCVFPMIPLTVSFFTKKAQSRKSGITNAMMYGLFIFMIYVILSLPFHFLDKLDPEILNNISTNVYLNMIFFIVFVIFAFSFFGFYDISLPASFSGTADRKAGLGNIVGIFFMALTLAIVSFSCTGPILGSLLAGSLTASGGAMQLTSGMAGFGLALALPFALFALFPNWLASLPKSGGWLNTVKVVLGFAELALALKFLSNADLVMHWGILKREVFIGLWMLISAGLTLYLFGLIRFPHDSPIKKLHVGRISLAVLMAAFTVYLAPGVTNTKWANLKLISGFPPPLYYSLYQQETDCVLGLHCTRDYEEGVQMAKAENKPILLDFTGYACVNCRRMEEKVWSQPDVYAMMNEHFIVVSLYVDDKQKLPASKRFTYTTKDGDVKEIKTVGDLWSTFETENFSNNAQPLYAILDTNEVLLNEPVGYTPNADEYLKWLSCGLETFRKGK